MDKNTIIGFLLIGAVLFAFSWLNQPSPEQIEAQRRYQDSIAQVEYEQQMAQQLQQQQATLKEDSLQNVPDSVKTEQAQNAYGPFSEARNGDGRNRNAGE